MPNFPYYEANGLKFPVYPELPPRKPKMKNYHDTYRLRIQNEQHFHEVLRKANHKEHTYAGPGFYFVTEWVEECPACGPRSFIELLHHASLRQEMARLQDQYAALQYNLKMLNKIPECYA